MRWAAEHYSDSVCGVKLQALLERVYSFHQIQTLRVSKCESPVNWNVMSFFSSSLCVCLCVICTFRSFSVSLCLNSDWQLQSCSLGAAYLLLHESLFLSLSPSLPHFPLSLTSSPAHKLSFSCQTVIDMFLYLQQSALHFCHHKTHKLKHFYSTQSPTGEILHRD